MMGRLQHLSGNVDDLARQLEQIWQKIPQETIRVLYHSMSRRVAACFQVREVKFTELNRTVTCMMLKANDRRTSSPLPQ
ncbi:hypothetical protein TNCV_801901 [Trichonephila clavipes]|nr:hypothetical protein TNCV_801901 [Trichonephila clavipes]